MNYLVFIVLGLLSVAPIWLVIWSVYVTRRNNATGELRRQVIEFVFDKRPGWEDRKSWFDDLPSYEVMCPLSPFAPFSNKPLRLMIGGKYEEEFWRRRAGDMRTTEKQI